MQTAADEALMPPAKHPPYRVLQAMRGVAACMVVIFHASVDWSLVATGSTNHAWWNGQAGVDLFFVISGFVMALTGIGKGDGARAAWRFLERRFARIFPLYWLGTALLAAKIFAGFTSDRTAAQHLSAGFLASSFLLIPHVSPTGDTHPLLGAGWTLSFEMLFYLCFAAALWLRKPVASLLTGVLCALTLVGLLHQPTWPAATTLFSPLLLEFLAGLWLGRAVQLGRLPPVRLASTLALVSVAALAIFPFEPQGDWQRLPWGLCGFLLIQAAIVLEPHVGSRIPRWALLIGDASFSIYLTHDPMMGLYTALLKRAHLLRPGTITAGNAAVCISLSVAMSLVIGILTYLLLERRINDWTRRALHLRRPVQTISADVA